MKGMPIIWNAETAMKRGCRNGDYGKTRNIRQMSHQPYQTSVSREISRRNGKLWPKYQKNNSNKPCGIQSKNHQQRQGPGDNQHRSATTTNKNQSSSTTGFKCKKCLGRHRPMHSGCPGCGNFKKGNEISIPCLGPETALSKPEKKQGANQNIGTGDGPKVLTMKPCCGWPNESKREQYSDSASFSSKSNHNQRIMPKNEVGMPLLRYLEHRLPGMQAYQSAEPESCSKR